MDDPRTDRGIGEVLKLESKLNSPGDMLGLLRFQGAVRMAIGIFAIIEGMFSALGLFIFYLWSDDSADAAKSVEPIIDQQPPHGESDRGISK